MLCYTEHLSACADDGHLYNLMPVPFTEEAALHVAERVLRVQDALGQRIGVENVSYYAAPARKSSASSISSTPSLTAPIACCSWM